MKLFPARLVDTSMSTLQYLDLKTFNSTNATIISFPAFAGGKFLSNCLALSKDACPQDSNTAEYLLQFPDDYNRRMAAILQTLPTSDQMKKWRSFEFGDRQLYGDAAFSNWLQGTAGQVNNITQQLCNSNMKFFISDHSMEPSKLITVWNNATVVKLINSEKFQSIAMRKKHTEVVSDLSQINGNYCRQKYNLLKGKSWPTWTEFDLQGYDVSKCNKVSNRVRYEIEQFYPLPTSRNPVILFNMDSCIFELDKFLSAVQDLYLKLNLLDFQSDLVEQFYKKYISLHI
jgi:hypothetical protein